MFIWFSKRYKVNKSFLCLPAKQFSFPETAPFILPEIPYLHTAER